MKNIIKKIKSFFTPNPVVSARYSKEIMTVKYKNGSIKQYKGSCTVWREMPYMQRCSTYTEMWLCDIWNYIKQYGNEYPNSHLVPDDDCNYDKTVY